MAWVPATASMAGVPLRRRFTRSLGRARHESRPGNPRPVLHHHRHRHLHLRTAPARPPLRRRSRRTHPPGKSKQYRPRTTPQEGSRPQYQHDGQNHRINTTRSPDRTRTRPARSLKRTPDDLSLQSPSTVSSYHTAHDAPAREIRLRASTRRPSPAGPAGRRGGHPRRVRPRAS